uniref:Si:dkey-19b23.8 n=1 Tax=Myripristis murdjan TaxID=586833 RepID=A0A667Z397_9TELE
ICSVSDKNSGCSNAPSVEETWKSGRKPEKDQSAIFNCTSAASSPSSKTVQKSSLRHTMSLSTFHLMQTLKNSPAALRRRFRPAKGKKLSKDHALVVRPRYVEVKELSTGRQLTKTYLQDIAYCAADANRPNVFLYICKHHGQQLQCRVFWCSRAERARDMTACLAHSFQRALSDWQDGSATLNPPDMKGKWAEESTNSPSTAKSCTLPASLGKGETLILIHSLPLFTSPEVLELKSNYSF